MGFSCSMGYIMHEKIHLPKKLISAHCFFSHFQYAHVKKKKKNIPINVSWFVYEAFHVNCPSARRASPINRAISNSCL